MSFGRRADVRVVSVLPRVVALAALSLAWQVLGSSAVWAAPSQSDQVVTLTNLERTNAGLAPLVVSPEFTSAAQNYSQVLAGGSCFAHTCGPVPDMVQRVEQAGFLNWTALAENIAAGQQTPEAVVQSWMNSPGHRANILNPSFTEIGVGVAMGGPYKFNWTQEFGSRTVKTTSLPAFQQLVPPDATADAPVDPGPPPDESGADIQPVN